MKLNATRCLVQNDSGGVRNETKPYIKSAEREIRQAIHFEAFATSSRCFGHVILQLDNPGVLTPPKDAPPRYQWQRAVEYSSFSDWQGMSRLFAPLFANVSSLSANSPLRQGLPVKEELNEHGKTPEAQNKAQEGCDLRNEGRVEDGKAPKTTPVGSGAE